jgi:hypothetical protein
MALFPGKPKMAACGGTFKGLKDMTYPKSNLF